jgi:hypothetical protein
VRTPYSESNTALEVVEKVESTDKYTFIYLNAVAALVIPRDSVSEGDYEAFVEAVRERVAETHA